MLLFLQLWSLTSTGTYDAWIYLLMKLITRLWSLVKYDFEVNTPKHNESKDWRKKKKSIDICSPWKSVAENNLTSWNTISTMAVLQQHHSISVYCVKLWVHNQILCPVTGKQTAIIISLIRRNSTFEGYIAHLIFLNKLKCGRGIMEAKEMFGPSKSDLGGMVILAIKKERATSSPTYVGGSLSETWNMYEKGHEKSMDNFPGGICTFLSLSRFVQFSWMTPLPNFSFK